MKKFTILIAAIALVCFSVPAMAVDWNFYGSARMATFYISEDIDDNGPIADGAAGDESKDSELQWDMQTNSRLGANVKAENLKAQFEFGISDSANNVSARRLYGVWNFGAGTLKVGKDYTPVSQFISGQVFDGDLGLLGIGTQYGSRHGQIAFGFGGFEIALINPNVGRLNDMEITATGALTVVTGSGGFTVDQISVVTDATGDVDQVLPKIEAKWGMSFDAWNFGLQGGFQYYSIEDVQSLEQFLADGTESRDDIDVTSWTIGGDIGFNFGPGYVKGALSYGSNIGNADWGIPSAAGGTSATGGLAQWDFDDDTNDTATFMGALVGGLKVSDMLSFEGGFGYRADNTDGGTVQDARPWAAYVQSVIALAPGVYVIPEVGYYDYDNNASGDDAGSLFYVGGKWQINF